MFRPVRLVLVSLLLFIPLFSVYGQEQSAASSARKFDEFGDLQISDMKARLDNFSVELNRDPANRGYVVVYRSRRDLPGLSARLLDFHKNYLLYGRGFPAERIVFVDGGAAANVLQQFWVAPPGTTPAVSPDAYPQYATDLTVPRKFDEFTYYGGEESFDFDPPAPGGGSLPAFAAQVLGERNSLAYVIFYPMYFFESWEDEHGRVERRLHQDRPAIIGKTLRELRAVISKEYRVPISRIKVVNGGYRRERSIELWIVPRGEHPPIATPNAFPPRRKRR
jgi:hypothetical protein